MNPYNEKEKENLLPEHTFLEVLKRLGGIELETKFTILKS
jgi:hypothetical protein